MEQPLVDNVAAILETQSIAAMPPPPYTPTENGASVPDAGAEKALANGAAETVRRREREATRMDMSVRRSKVLSRAGLDDPVFFKMSQLEQLVNSLQTALNDQSMAIHDVHGQLTEINDVLHTMQAKDGSTSSASTKEAAKQPIEPERLVEDLRAAAAKFSSAKKPTASASEKAVEAAKEDVANDDDDDDGDDTFEDAEDDGNYLRLCSMLENLIVDANIAVETSVSVFPEVPADADTASATIDAVAPSMESAASGDPGDDTSAHSDMLRRRQRRERRSGSGARIRPVKLVAEPGQSHAALDDKAVAGAESAFGLPDDEVGLLDADTVATDDGPDAVEVRFFCQVKRTGETPQQHEIRRRLVLPLLTGNNLMPSNIRRIVCGEMGAAAVAAGGDTSVSYRGSVIRRALGTVQLMYWLLLFTLGVLMLDTYLCELAGSQAVHIVDGICPEDRRRHRRHPHGLLAATATQSGDPDAAQMMEYTGMKPVTLDGADAPMTRSRSRRNSF
ncbi:hypothetical protein SYNPS1DRAFT_28863 [Syncephalis pseudoplumigaleata]|uniref:Uncharacterized protein n=1 Tax=Syncephalis pseudoplumigaleata TaxID=1712513 RepID=A0A4P9YZI7_9FUNG|nr:hypothetical protein SYNPS1DRAFT_28863 [Syncephalis pseudoplumigaleata]|eukprot:RKP25408.1 hypothetical protein SYNPS1DRAFT_28863 [Syncephalis pseudoplumigaleata]